MGLEAGAPGGWKAVVTCILGILFVCGFLSAEIRGCDFNQWRRIISKDRQEFADPKHLINCLLAVTLHKIILLLPRGSLAVKYIHLHKYYYVTQDPLPTVQTAGASVTLALLIIQNSWKYGIMVILRRCVFLRGTDSF